MFKKNQQNQTQTAPSLQLSTILEEEFAYINPSKSSVAKVPTGLFHIHKPHEFMERLGYTGLTKTNEMTFAGTVPDTYTRYDKPYERLAQWTHEESAGKALTALDAVFSIQQTLIRKAGDPALLQDEPWLLDMASRSYTRGLRQRYIDHTPIHPTLSDADILNLNQLLLEDAYAEYVQTEDSARLNTIFDTMRNENQRALCLSGGGIRSATFALGIIQGLANLDLLDKFTYLSTVSGGGYIGGWLSAWSHHEGYKKVVDRLKEGSNTPLAVEADPIINLRKYSNYLSPRLGLLSADTWTLIAIYVRNLLMIWLVILPYLAALAAAPWVAVSLTSLPIAPSAWYTPVIMGGLGILAVILLISAVKFLHTYVPEVEKTTRGKPTPAQDEPVLRHDQSAFLRRCLTPLTLGILILMLLWNWIGQLDGILPDRLAEIVHSMGLDQPNTLIVFSTGSAIFIGVAACIHFIGWLLAGPTHKSIGLQLLQILLIALIGAVAGLLMLLTIKLLWSDIAVDAQAALYTCLAFPCFLLGIMLSGYVFDGIISRFNADSRREWTARYSAWLLIVGLGWLVITGLILFGPGWVYDIKAEIASIGLSSGLLTALLGGSAKTAGDGEAAGSRGGKGEVPGIWSLLSNYSLPIAALLTLVILMTMLSLLNLTLIRLVSTHFGLWHGYLANFSAKEYEGIPFYIPLAILILFVLGGWILASLIDTNRFSLHAMYRARLIRAYLGASRQQSERRPDPFTGFDEQDNVMMGELDQVNGQKPEKTPLFHIINLALNLVGGQNLAWQERKAETFSVSTLHAGSMNLGYRPTRPVGKSTELYGGANGISLGTAITISGAAASPNMGYHSSPLIAFLMTLFNVRLGWWLGNPGPAGAKTFNKAMPSSAVRPIFDELIGSTDDVNKYVYLSDGGHFENLGLYEMVLRRNRFIIVSDAGCDEQCTLEDLGNAIRKIRIDLGIPIVFNSDFNIRARFDTTQKSPGRYWAFGRILYSAVDARQNEDGQTKKTPAEKARETDGLLLYIKPGIYGNEPRDVYNYAVANKAFPHESTGDQFFSESQFESYRTLGKHALETLDSALRQEGKVTFSDLFTKQGVETYLGLLAAQHLKDQHSGKSS